MLSLRTRLPSGVRDTPPKLNGWPYRAFDVDLSNYESFFLRHQKALDKYKDSDPSAFVEVISHSDSTSIVLPLS